MYCGADPAKHFAITQALILIIRDMAEGKDVYDSKNQQVWRELVMQSNIAQPLNSLGVSDTIVGRKQNDLETSAELVDRQTEMRRRRNNEG